MIKVEIADSAVVTLICAHCSQWSVVPLKLPLFSSKLISGGIYQFSPKLAKWVKIFSGAALLVLNGANRWDLWSKDNIQWERKQGKHERVTMVESVFVRQNLDRYMYYFHYTQTCSVKGLLGCCWVISWQNSAAILTPLTKLVQKAKDKQSTPNLNLHKSYART